LQVSEYRLLRRFASKVEQGEAEGLFWSYADVEENGGPGKALSFQAFLALNQRWKVFTEADLSRFATEYPPSAATLCQFGAGMEGHVHTLQWRFRELGQSAETELQWLRHSMEEGQELEAAWLGCKLLEAATKEALGSRRLTALLPACLPALEAALATIA